MVFWNDLKKILLPHNMTQPPLFPSLIPVTRRSLACQRIISAARLAEAACITGMSVSSVNHCLSYTSEHWKQLVISACVVSVNPEETAVLRKRR